MSKKWIYLALKVCVSGALIWYLLSGIDLNRVWAQLIDVSPAMLVAAAVILLFQIVIGAFRWRVAAVAIGISLPVAQAVRMFYIGAFFNQALPGGTGGDAVRMYLGYKSGFGLRGAINSVILERVATVLALVFLVGATQASFLPRLDEETRAVVLPTVLMVTVAAVAGTVILCLLDRSPESLRRWKLVRGLGHLAGDARSVFLRPRNAASILAWSALGHVNISACVYVMALGLGLGINLIDCIVLMPPVLLVMTLPISIGGWGVRENAMVFAFGLVGVSQEAATVLGVLLGFVGLATALPGGLVWLATRGDDHSISLDGVDGDLAPASPEES
jgi:uncharacterized protein (TIRG00374 family)